MHVTCRCTVLPAALVVLTMLVVSACGDSTGPEHRRLRFVAGNGAADTVDAQLLQALVVEVRDPSGRLVPGTTVRFQALPADPSLPYGDYGVYVGNVAGCACAPFAADTTNSRGRASALVRLGRHAGPAHVVVSVPEFGLVDTATFTVRAGAAARVVALPHDTAVYVGGSVTLRSAVTDRYGNPRPDPASLAVVDGGVTLAGKVVTGRAIGPARVAVSAIGLSDTTHIVVVPQGTLAAATYVGVVTINLDGSGYRVLTPSHAEYAKWAPDGSAVAFDQGYATPAHVVTTSGEERPVSQTSLGDAAEMYPSFSHDGSWVYFSAALPGGFRLWRVHADGTGAEQLASADARDDFFPSASPDGTRIAYVLRKGYGQDTLRILELATGAVTDLHVAGHSPAWSPVGDQIAYIDIPAGWVVKVMRPDGTGQRQISPSGMSYERGIDWSPDGGWLVAFNTTRWSVDLIEVATGTVLPLTFRVGTTLMSPSWKP
jgi:Tol biopolymer transport system component